MSGAVSGAGGPTPQQVAERAVAASRSAERAVIVEVASTAHLRWAENAVTAAGHIQDHRVTVIASARRRDGVATAAVTGQVEPGETLDDLVRAADLAALGADPDPYGQGLVDKARTAPGPDEATGWDDAPAEASFQCLAPVAASLHAAVERASAEGRRLYGYAESGLRTTYVASSTGLRLRHVQPEGLLDLTARTADGTAATWAGSPLTTPGPDHPDTRARHADVAALDLRLRDRLSHAHRRVRLPSGRYEVLLSPTCVADLMLHLYRAMGADDALDGRSPFGRDGRTRIGERLASLPLTLSGDPAFPGLECVPFVLARATDGTVSATDTGLPLERTDWIGDGTLSALVQTRRSAVRTGLPVTPWIDNLRLTGPPDARPLREMVAGTDRALLITSLWYVRPVDPGSLLLTGLTRDGVLLVEHGEIVGAAGDFRFDESPLHMLRRVAEAGRTVRALPREWGDGFTRTAMPPLRIADFPLLASDPPS